MIKCDLPGTGGCLISGICYALGFCKAEFARLLAGKNGMSDILRLCGQKGTF